MNKTASNEILSTQKGLIAVQAQNRKEIRQQVRAARRKTKHIVPPPAFKVHTPGLLKEILNCSQQAVYRIPIRVFADLLGQVAQRASELNDWKLNDLMCKLTLYEIADPESKDYDLERVKRIEQKVLKLR